MNTWSFLKKLLVRTERDYTITLSDVEPAQSGSPHGGYTVGEEATIFRTDDGGWGYCFHGIGDSGLYSESDDVTGFKSAREAEVVAREDYAAGEANAREAYAGYEAEFRCRQAEYEAEFRW